MGRRYWTSLRKLSASLLVLLAACADPDAKPEGIGIGALVPFTGVSAAGGANYERAMLLAVEHLNAEAETSGQRFYLAAQDSHSETERTLVGLERLLDQDVIGLIGPERVELVEATQDELGSEPLARILPSSMTLGDLAPEGPSELIRPVPSAEFVGCALAERVYQEQKPRMAVIHAQDAYRSAFAASVVSAFESFRYNPTVGVGLAIPIPDGSSNYSAIIAEAKAFEPDTVVLVAEAPVAAAIVRDWTTLARKPVAWFLEPGLRSQEFLNNVDPRSLEGAIGVSLALPDSSEDFRNAYSARWNGEEPLVESYFYFDAAIAMGLATLKAMAIADETPTRAEVEAQMLTIARGPGRRVTWTNLSEAMELIAEGTSVHYQGASGRWSLDGMGVSDARTTIFGFWKVRDGEIFAENFGACGAGTITVGQDEQNEPGEQDEDAGVD